MPLISRVKYSMAFEICQFKLIELKIPLFKDLPYNCGIISVLVYDYVSSPFIKHSLYNWERYINLHLKILLGIKI